MEIEKAIESLKEYIEQDDIYTIYKQDRTKIESDFDMFCVEHCQAIQALLNELERNKEDFKIVDKECSRLEEVELKQNKVIDRIKQEYDKQINLFNSTKQKETDFSLLYFTEELLERL